MDKLTYTTQEVIQLLNNRFPDCPIGEGWLRMKRKGRTVNTKTKYGEYQNEYDPILKPSDISHLRNGGILYGRIALEKLITERAIEVDAKRQGKYKPKS